MSDRPAGQSRPSHADPPPAASGISERLRELRGAAGRIPRPVWIAWGATLLAFAPVYRGWVGDWIEDPNYSQGFLIPLITLYLCARALRRDPTAGGPHAVSVRASWIGMALTALGLVAYLFGTGGSEVFTMRSGFVFTFLGGTWWIAGAALGAALSVPILFLLFSIPIPAVLYFNIAVPLQTGAAMIATAFLELVGVPVSRAGNTLSIPGMSLEVAEACSGIRSLTVLLALGALWAYVAKGSPARRLLVFLATIPLAVVGNGVRVSLTALGAHLFGAGVTEGLVHELMGLVVFLVTFAGLMGLSRVLGTDS